MNERINASETKQSKVIFPNGLNDHETLFGGKAMKWMDEVAYITAIRHSRKKMVTVSCHEIKFLLPVKSGTIVDIIGKVKDIKTFKIVIEVEIFVEDMFGLNRQKRLRLFLHLLPLTIQINPFQLMIIAYAG